MQRTFLVDDSFNSQCALYVYKYLGLKQVLPLKRFDNDQICFCTLPTIVSTDKHNDFSTAGLCNVIRQMFKMKIKMEKCELKNKKLTAMLGYKQGCLKACAGVSPWTSYCEIELPSVVDKLSQSIPSLSCKSQKIVIPIEIEKFEQELIVPKRQCNPLKYKSGRKRKSLCERDGVELEQTNDQNILQRFFSKLGFSDVDKLPELKCGNGDIDLRVGQYACGPYFSITDLLVLYMLLTVLSKMKCVCYVNEFLRHLPNILGWLGNCLSKPDIFHICVEEFSNHQSKSCKEICRDFSLIFVRTSEQSEQRCVTYTEKRAVITPNNELLAKMLDNKELTQFSTYHKDVENLNVIDWGNIPTELNPIEGGINEKRSLRKRQQIENMLTHITRVSRNGDTIVDFCSGGGHLGIVVAFMLKECQVILVENKEESIDRALDRINKLKLNNIHVYLSNLNYFTGKFNVAMSLHACGSATDLVLAKCLEKKASYVISPCCYGGIRSSHGLLEYPKSKIYRSLLSEEDYYFVSRSSDRTSATYGSESYSFGKSCMLLTDTDRILHTTEYGYSGFIVSMKPLTCSPKNNIIVGTVI